MSSLPPISIVPNKSKQIPIRISGKANNLPPLSVGEIVDAEIVRSLSNSSVLIELKGKRIVAHSPEARHSGERITVRVDQVKPSIVLRIMSQHASTATAIAAQHITRYHSNPVALIDSLLQLGRIFNQSNPAELYHHIGMDNVNAMQTMLSSMMLSDSTSDSSFFKNYLLTLGLLLENQLSDACLRRFGKAKAIKGATNNLKGLLTQIINKIQTGSGNPNHPGMEQLLRASDTAIKTIESFQIMNAVLQEQEQKYLFQIPIIFPDGTGTAEIFMKYDHGSEQRKGQKKSWTLHCLLSMDALGDITVETQIESKKVSCTIYCQEEAVRLFIQPRIEEIQEKLSALGYDVSSVACFVRAEKGEIRERLVSISHLDDHDGVNVVV